MNNNRPWTEEDTAHLKTLWDDMVRQKDICSVMHRHNKTITRMVKQLALPARRFPGQAGWWTPEMDAQLRELFAQNLTYAEIGSRMGGVTEGSVNGRARLLGIRRTAEETKAINAKRKAELAKPKLPRVRVRKPKPAPAISELPVLPQAYTETDGVSIWDLKHSHCRWPIHGHGAEMRYCGREKMDGSSYCTSHYAKSISADQAHALKQINVAAKYAGGGMSTGMGKTGVAE